MQSDSNATAQPGTVLLTVGGDIAPLGASAQSLTDRASPDVWGDIAETLRRADFAIANLECPLTGRQQGTRKRGPVIRAVPECANGIRAAGFHAVSLANNHIMDMGALGLGDTLEACARSGLETVGAGKTLDAATAPLIVEKNGLRIAILAFAEREFSIAGPGTAGAAPADPIANSEQIREAKQRADVVIVLLHGGNEYYPLPRPGMARYCRFLIRCGAAAVVCHHSHVAAPVERYNNGLICYGVGNLLFDGIVPRNDAWYVGYLLHLQLSREGVQSYRITPFRQLQRVCRLERLSDEEQSTFFARLEQLSAKLQSDEQLAREWSAFCETRAHRYIASLRAPVEVRGLPRLMQRYPSIVKLLLPARARLFVLGLLRCDSHREAMETILSALEERG
jgi:poly-gamma-glutamate capsule biosynthesis protein CapA/YwtB (metallophosphatase superfamily)